MKPTAIQYLRFQKLLTYRKAYWILAGYELGLDKPWVPNWKDDTHKYCIVLNNNELVRKSYSYDPQILAFPTIKLRNDFLKKCRELILECQIFLTCTD